MNLYIKMLGAVLVAILAVSALVAPVAPAAQFTVSPGTILTGQQLPGVSAVYTGDFGKVKCNGVAYPGVVSQEETKGGTKDTVFTITPEFEPCEKEGVETTIDPTGCDFVLFANGTLNLKCPTGKTIDIRVAELCEITIRPQEAVPKVEYTKDPNDSKSLIVDVSSEGLQYEEHGMLCASQNQLTKNGSFTSQFTVKGEDTKGGQVTITFDP